MYCSALCTLAQTAGLEREGALAVNWTRKWRCAASSEWLTLARQISSITLGETKEEANQNAIHSAAQSIKQMHRQYGRRAPTSKHARRLVPIAQCYYVLSGSNLAHIDEFIITRPGPTNRRQPPVPSRSAKVTRQ